MASLTTYPQMLAAFAFCLFALGIGLIWLLWPKKMRDYALEHHTKFYFWPNPFLGWMKTRSYLVYLRVMGAVFVAAGLYVLLFALRSYGTVLQLDCEKHMKEEIHRGTPLEVAVAALKKCGFETAADPVKKTLYGDKRVTADNIVFERTWVFINLDSGNRVATVSIGKGLVGP
jgi:hypothetical protein